MKEAILLTHTIAGIAVFAIGVIQAILPKRGVLHRILGRTYVLIWFPLIISGGIIGSWIITALGALGLYCALTGWRYANSKKNLEHWLDKLIAILGGLMVLALIGGAVYLFYLGAVEFGVIMAVFSVIFGSFVFTDLREVVFGAKVRKLSKHKMYWFFEHYGRMYVSMIAAVTAFSAIQQPFGNQIVNWLWPTVFGTLILVYLGNKYKAKFGVV
tara:strand:+ start:110207 stop:110848 length:642 start_codon:yes stop_codon:yes gene_type:complete